MFNMILEFAHYPVIWPDFWIFMSLECELISPINTAIKFILFILVIFNWSKLSYGFIWVHLVRRDSGYYKKQQRRKYNLLKMMQHIKSSNVILLML